MKKYLSSIFLLNIKLANIEKRDAYIIKVYLIPEKRKERRMELKRFRDEHPELEVDLSRFCL